MFVTNVGSSANSDAMLSASGLVQNHKNRRNVIFLKKYKFIRLTNFVVFFTKKNLLAWLFYGAQRFACNGYDRENSLAKILISTSEASCISEP